MRSKLKLEMLRIDVSDINFDDEVLANVLKLTNLEIHLKLDIPFDTQGYIHNKNTLKILTKFSKLFVPCERKMSILSISVGNEAPNCFSLR
uniref:Uncharacterized protein n=1 Tax=Panagrolaimus sp. PS1159 TaxID=55785 RepID=A0AC35G7J4_9BILA